MYYEVEAHKSKREDKGHYNCKSNNPQESMILLNMGRFETKVRKTSMLTL